MATDRGDAARGLGTVPKRKRLQGSQGIGGDTKCFATPLDCPSLWSWDLALLGFCSLALVFSFGLALRLRLLLALVLGFRSFWSPECFPKSGAPLITSCVCAVT